MPTTARDPRSEWEQRKEDQLNLAQRCKVRGKGARYVLRHLMSMGKTRSLGTPRLPMLSMFPRICTTSRGRKYERRIPRRSTAEMGISRGVLRR